MQTVIGLVPADNHLQNVQTKLEEVGLASEQIQQLRQPGTVWQKLNGRRHLRTVNKYGWIGALAGVVITTAFGVVAAGILTPGYMQAHPTTSITVLVLAVLIGLGAGWLFGATVGMGDVDEYVYSYMEGVRRGDVLLIVPAPEEDSDAIVDILRSENGKVIKQVQP